MGSLGFMNGIFSAAGTTGAYICIVLSWHEVVTSRTVGSKITNRGVLFFMT